MRNSIRIKTAFRIDDGINKMFVHVIFFSILFHILGKSDRVKLFQNVVGQKSQSNYRQNENNKQKKYSGFLFRFSHNPSCYSGFGAPISALVFAVSVA